VNGAPINPGFAGDQRCRRAENFAETHRSELLPIRRSCRRASEPVKVPAWLNDPIYYHNRGNSDWVGESSLYGDFAGLDDLATENPRVVQGFIDIYGRWIDEFGIDGFRIDTAKPREPRILAGRSCQGDARARAKARGIPNFHIFGEVAMSMRSMSGASRAGTPTRAGLPAVLDFGFARAAVQMR
jgi:glycosidase